VSARPAFLIETEYETAAGLPRTGLVRWTKIAWRRLESALGRHVPVSYPAREVRRRTYQAELSLIGGVVYGNGEVWTFGPEWKEALESDGARDMRHLTTLMDSVPWWELVPSGLGALHGTEPLAGTDDAATGGDVAAAASPDGRWLVAYVPGRGTGPRRVQIRAPKTADGGSVRARWFDPTAGMFFPAQVTVSAGGPLAVVTPGLNEDGDGDWALVLETGRPSASVAGPDGG